MRDRFARGYLLAILKCVAALVFRVFNFIIHFAPIGVMTGNRAERPLQKWGTTKVAHQIGTFDHCGYFIQLRRQISNFFLFHCNFFLVLPDQPSDVWVCCEAI